MLWIMDGFEGRELGKQLLAEVEKQLISRQARILIVETSQLPEFDVARAFYNKNGFILEAQINNFFDAGDNQLIYTKLLK